MVWLSHFKFLVQKNTQFSLSVSVGYDVFDDAGDVAVDEYDCGEGIEIGEGESVEENVYAETEDDDDDEIDNEDEDDDVS
ncbi:hypothetical protein QR98_0020020 [Sarcoptes scabiei]|uniref:Uncharacterized protein n=1 Tax=Sarcoptes scabiei TaxID=52283 RepID=A0A131ZYH8_SARSC|nr:hypothetical protein QR98_0020020 [Sarcoptes scabiei]